MAHHRSHRDQPGLGRTVRSRSIVEVEQAAAHLEALAKGLRQRGVSVRRGAEFVALKAGEKIDLDLEVGEEGRDTVVRLELSWETPVTEEPLVISSGAQSSESPSVVPQPNRAPAPGGATKP